MHLRRPLFLTRLGLGVERGMRAFWPVWTIALIAAAPFPLRLHEGLPLAVPRLWLAFWALAALAALVWGLRQFRWPSADEARARVDATLPGRPLAALRDAQALGQEDGASRALWQAHLARMEAASHAAQPVAPDLRLAPRDPFALRLIALLVFATAVIFAPLMQPQGQAASPVITTADGQILPAGPSWEGWIEPPAYTLRPSLYLADLPPGEIAVIPGSRVTIRFYGAEGENRIEETVSSPAPGADPLPEGQFLVARAGDIRVTGTGGAEWQVSLLPDLPPTIALTGEREVDGRGQMAQPFRATDDFAVVSGMAEFTIDLARINRIHGLTFDPAPREPLIADLPMPFTGNRAEFEEKLIEDFSEHPLANLPVTMVLTVRDAAGQESRTEAVQMILPGRRFFQPVARAVIEQRRDLLWSVENAPRVLDLLRAIAHRPESLFTSEVLYLRLSFINRQLAGIVERGAMTPDEEAELSQALWDLAVQLEDGTLADARERLRRAQERLSEAMRNGASAEEIADLMEELRQATDDYLQMLADSAEPPEDMTDQPQSAENQQQMVTQDQIQALMDEIQRLMEEGNMAEAEALMQQLDELLQNLEIQQAEGQGNGPRMPGQQQMEELQDTLRDQQELSDDAFRDLQDQFNGREPQRPQNPGQQGQDQQGQQPGQEGQEPGGEQSEGQEPGAGQDEGTEDGGTEDGGTEDGGRTGEDQGEDGQGENGQGSDGQSLAERQQALRDLLEGQRAQLPGLTGEAAERARRALEEAEGAMDRAEEALRDGNLAEAIDNQAQALNALRQGLRDLGEAFASQNRDPTEPGTEDGTATAENGQRVEPARRDPLGRQLGQTGQFGTDQQMLQGEDVYRRAEELLEELRRRAGELSRDPTERDYLRRLLERF